MEAVCRRPVSSHDRCPPYLPPSPYPRAPETPLPAVRNDRRHHHDHEPYPPIQDPSRQLPPSPAHPPYPPYDPREPAVKRDPIEDNSLSQLHRPNSTGHGIVGADGLPAPYGPPHNPNQQHPDDPRRPMSFDGGHNGPSMPHSPAMYRPPPQTYHPPPTPVSQHPQYGEPRVYVYGPQTPIYPTLEIQAASAKRKAQRASLACDSCRQLKAKCDETKPCKNCREKGMDCIYRDPPAKQPDKVSADILELLSTLREEISSVKVEVFTAAKKSDHRLKNVEATLRNMNPEAASMKVESIEGEDRQGIHQSPIPDDKAAEDQHSPGGTVAGPRGPLSLGEAQEMIRNMNDEDIEDQPGPSVMPGKPAMPLNHTALANLLLKWPSIHAMVHHLLAAEKINYIDEFPIRQEQLRGMLRVFGKGEGFDANVRVADKSTPQDHTMTEAGEDYPDAASPVPTGEVWGKVGSLTPPPGVKSKGGVLNVDGNPDWDPNRVWKYVQSFKDDMLNMHPIIIPRELDAIVTIFLDALPKSVDNSGKSAPSAKQSNIARFINQPTTALPPSMPEIGRKRKRLRVEDEEPPSVSFKKAGRPFRSVDNALVLLVLALGKICLHKDKLPDVVRDSEAPSYGSPSVRNGVLASPTQGSTLEVTSHSRLSGLPSPQESKCVPMSRKSSLQGINPLTRSAQSNKRNMEVIPGLKYFALATDIIGSHLGGFNLKHVWMLILAGLYHGQLGRVLESWSYISSASRNLQVILRPSLDRLTSKDYLPGQHKRDNQLAFAFWTCLQLKSDILAELPLPQSGILQYESQMPYPDLSFAVNHGFSVHIVSGYLAQLYLRKQLNQVHSLLYNPENDEGQTFLEDMNRIQAMLKDTRDRWVPQDYRWNDGDPPATDILSARLRAKYWGSQVILHRPLLKMILENETSPLLLHRVKPVSTATWDTLGLNAGSPSVPPHAHLRTIQYARLAIKALVESTRAFHGMDSTQRIIVTNVFGTAYAQWGNLLILAACYRDKFLVRFIDRYTLSTLFTRTIAFFKMIAYPSSALINDMNILIGLAKDLGLENKAGVKACPKSSIGSTTCSTRDQSSPPSPALLPQPFSALNPLET
ncbi:hypothetical protein F5Y15DRAFT_429310 [Xylariaceae sp. FL0016]|nr:hypothetical protein F5Y15DRAFT_429310 [Xylariaceae sp. FL0016]